MQIDFVRFLHCNFVLCEYDSMKSKGFSHFVVSAKPLKIVASQWYHPRCCG